MNITASCVAFLEGKREYPKGDENQKERMTKMELNELIETLEEFRDSPQGASLELKVAQQPGWPLAASVETVTRIGNTLWIATREDGDYAPKSAWEGGDLDADPEDESEDED